MTHLKVQSATPDLKARAAEIPDVETACVACAVKVEGESFTVFQLLPVALARSMLA